MTEPYPNPRDFGFDDEAEVMQIVHDTTVAAIKAGKPAAEMGDLPPSVRLYNDAVIAWHKATGAPFETDAEYRDKLRVKGY